MSNIYSKTLGQPVPQSEQANPRQEKNNAGGFTFVVDDKTRLQRFLILGTEGGTYYQDEQKLTKENFNFLRELIERDEQIVIDTVRDVSVNGRALRNTQAILTVAALFTYGKIKPKELVRDVCRTSTHLFEFAEFIELLAEGSNGWGSAKRAAVAQWYQVKRPSDLAYQGIKYRQRNGWTHKDLMRLSHPVGLDKGVGAWLLGKSIRDEDLTSIPDVIVGFTHLQALAEAGKVSDIVNILIRYPKLPWEAIPTQFHKEPQVWQQLFYNGALTGQALVRNITRLSRIGAFKDMVFAADYAAKLADAEMIKRSRLHPLNYLQALVVHTEGQLNREDARYGGMIAARRTKDWVTVPVIVDALNAGFYKAFEYVEPTNKRTFLALDVSGSMSSSMSGLEMSAAEVVAAMAMATAKVEPYYQIFGFSDGYHSTGAKFVSSTSYHRSVLADLRISPGMNLRDVMRKTADQNFGRTDCALPMTYAMNNKIEVDTFVIYTDNETWCGRVHPYVALNEYRSRMGIDAKLIVVACTPTRFSIADPSDRGMLDVVGCDSNLPKLISEFSLGRI